MKITIDTKEDSSEEIRKVINLLSNIVKGDEMVNSNTDLFSTSKDVFSGTRADSNVDVAATSDSSTPIESSSNQNAFANMFGDSSTPAKEEPVIDLANLSSLRETEEKTEEEKEDVKVVSY